MERSDRGDMDKRTDEMEHVSGHGVACTTGNSGTERVISTGEGVPVSRVLFGNELSYPSDDSDDESGNREQRSDESGCTSSESETPLIHGDEDDDSIPIVEMYRRNQMPVLEDVDVHGSGSQTITGKNVERFKIIGPGKPITPFELMTFMGVSGATKGSVGVKKIRQQGLHSLEAKVKKKLLSVFRNIVIKAAHSFVPTNPLNLVTEALRDVMPCNIDSEHLQRCLSACRKGSLEKRLVRAIIHGCLPDRSSRTILAKDVQNVDGIRRLSRRRRAGERNGVATEEGTVISDDEVRRLSVSVDRRRTGNFGSMLRRAKQDWVHLTKTGFVVKPKHRRMSVSTDTILDSVAFMFEQNNRQILATGSKKVRLHDGEVIELPCIRRTKSRLQIYSEYVKRKQTSAVPRALGKSSFMKVIRVLTSGQQQIKHCVDYCFGVLLFENFRTVSYIVDKRVTDVATKKELSDGITAVSDFLKHGYQTHIDMDWDSAHDSIAGLVGPDHSRDWRDRTGNDKVLWSKIQHDISAAIADGYVINGTVINALPATCAASREEDTKRASTEAGISKCNTCLKYFQVIENVRSAVRPEEDGVGEVLDDASHKLKLFMGHGIRCKVQNTVIDEVYRSMLHAPAETSAVLTMDYKMKYEPQKYREKSSDWYGRKGISWHGTVVTYKPKDEDGNDVSADANGEWNRIPDVKHIFYDHICRNSTEQSTFSVLSIIEIVAYRITTEYPSMKTIHLRTDNAANYHNRILPVVAPFIFSKYDLKLCSIIHNETQDGKGPAELHFAVVTRFVDRYITSRSLDVVTAQDLVKAINHGDGVKGTIAELFDVDMDNDNMKLWKNEQRKKAKDSSFQTLGRCNTIEYGIEHNSNGSIQASSRAYKYSRPIQWRFTQSSSTRLTAFGPEDVDINDVGELQHGETANDGNFRELQSNDSDVVLYCEVAAFTGQMTGVKVFLSGSVTREATRIDTLARRILPCLPSNSNVNERLSGNQTNRDRSTAGTSERLLRNASAECVSSGSSADMYTSDEADIEDAKRFRFNGVSFYCRKCGASYDDRASVLNHWTSCTVHAQSCHVVDRACRSVEKLIAWNKVVVNTHPEKNAYLEKIIVTEGVRQSNPFEPFWAVRPKKGGTLGRNFIGPFKQAVLAMIERGNVDKGKKLSCSQMQEQLRLSNPNRYDIPTVHNIDSYVKSCLTKMKTAARREKEGLNPVGDRYFMPVRYADCIEVVIRGNDGIKPRMVEEKVLARLGINEDAKPLDFPSAVQIARKASSLKQKVRKKKSSGNAKQT